ncbi:ORF MSV202 hypothetical protein [Melanoplus sanguinipes entomopoxvirus]|uniref:Uncharacterized protein n=1 Tax=Melanoplus sanguinipes entomopoxvirus TaxID=83191 RepID=Q9YVP0_MSEPV|nr:ORF MSV202 hypothetical protein [Melanoplus sanguinipes entomopoxvirus]AAC97758.1 ORF MSV202 hypothetical protein [Melanoplus sanguinipes entomopoxvirus 'O']
MEYINNSSMLSIKYIKDNLNNFLNIPYNAKLKYHKLEDFDEIQYDNLLSKIYNDKQNYALLKYLITIGIKYHNIKDDYLFLLPINMFDTFIYCTDNIKIKYLFHKYKIENANKFDNICNYLAWIDPIYYINKIGLVEKMGFYDINDLLIYLYNFTYDIFTNNAYKYIKDETLKNILIYICPFIYNDNGIIKIRKHKYKYLLPYNNELQMLSIDKYTRFMIFIANNGKWNIPEIIDHKEEIICEYLNIELFDNYILMPCINKWLENNKNIINNKIIKLMLTHKLKDSTIKLIFDSLDIHLIYNLYKKYYKRCIPEIHNIIKERMMNMIS